MFRTRQLERETPTTTVDRRCDGDDRAWESGDVDVGVDSFAAVVTDPDTGAVVESAERMAHLLEEIELADRVGLASYGIGEHHRVEYYDAAPAVILAAAAARTSQIRLRSAVTVLSAADPVRVFQEFATVDLISGGRVELVVGRGSFTEAFPLFGLDLADYDELFDEKLDLLLRLREAPRSPGRGATGRLWCGSASTRAPCRIRCPSGWASAAPRSPSSEPASGPPADGGHHRRRAATVRTARRPVPACRRRGRAPTGDAARRPALLRLPR
jgi:alkanesulfonate monooxygenase SsuD/methylene tetrahydromethanopterin reductase-like flavin-dependent oxidoreductase (luciferase family)